MGQSKQQRLRAQQKRATKRAARAKTATHLTKTTNTQDILSLLPKYKRLPSFHNYAETVKAVWAQTYFIARGRKVSEVEMKIKPLGTGFLAGAKRMITCAHCLVEIGSTDPLSKHQDGDVYFFVSRDGNGKFHQANVTDLKIDKNLFVYSEFDISVIELPDTFYTNGSQVFKHPDAHFILSAKPVDIGSDVGVLGYPFQNIRGNKEQTGLDISGVLIRVDRGVINASYKDAATQLYKYEFTMSFNPGNSGGPIIRPEDGKVIAWVKGFNSTPFEIGEGENKSKIFAHYSEGISTMNLEAIAKKHNLAFE